jgi:hypothetical protein
MTSDTRSVVPNGPLVAAYRKQRGWSREEFEWQSHLAVERAASEVTGDGRFRQRYQAKTSKGSFAGIGTTGLANIERGRPVYAFTLKIVAVTLGVPVRNLIHPADPSFVAASLGADSASASDGIAKSILDKAIDPAKLPDREKAAALRKLLDALFPPSDNSDEDS